MPIKTTASVSQRLVEMHKGNITQMAAEAQIDRNTMSDLLCQLRVTVQGQELNGLQYASRLRVQNTMRGPRKNPRRGSDEWHAQRSSVVEAIAISGGQRQAADVLGVGYATVTRRVKFFKITPAEVERVRKAMQSLSSDGEVRKQKRPR